ncbi:DUF1566 domain-containing protein [Polaribacter sp.]|nr:DUF1566 domain-containing protein [Polaribacter sp.]
MKQLFTFLVAVLLTATTYAQVGIGTTTPDASAALDITSTTGGLLVPRMTAVERDAITSPAQGLIIFCIDCASGEGELQIKLTSSWKNTIGGDVNDPIVVGDFYQGGVVFYIFVDGDTGYVAGETHGLIAAEQDQSSGIRWYNGSYVTTEATSTALGTGATNTTAIISAQGATETSYAAGLARAYTGGGYTDWFLPSKDELNKMYLNIGQGNALGLGNVGGFASNYYWSSTEGDNLTAWSQKLGNGNLGLNGKSNLIYVRAVRAF